MAETVEAPEKPPESWLTTDPDGAVPGLNLTVDHDGSLWGEPGRAWGLIQPEPGKGYVGGGSAHGHKIPPIYPDETFRDFHCGSAQFINDAGEVVQRKVGNIQVEGGHSNQSPNFAVLAENGSLRERLQDAKDWLFRSGKHSHMINDLAVRGQVTRVKDGPNKGALIFRGAAYPWLTKDQALAINGTTVSSEQWSHPDFGGRKQFIGVSRVHQSSYGYDPVLAEAGEAPVELDHDVMSIVPCVGDECPCEPSESIAPIVVESAEEPQLIAAEVTEPEFNAVEDRLERLGEQVDRLESLYASLAIIQSDGQDINLEARIDGMADRQASTEERLVEILRTLERLTQSDPAQTDAPTPLP